METLNESDGPVHDVIIIGAGPCGLAVARAYASTHTLQSLQTRNTSAITGSRNTTAG